MVNRTCFWVFCIQIGFYAAFLILFAMCSGCATSGNPELQSGNTNLRSQDPVNQKTKPPRLNLALLQGRVAICRLPPTSAVPSWATADASFSSVTRTKDELSIVCAEPLAPANIKHEAGWRIFKVAGPLDFALTGILASMADPLAKAGVSIFAISTFDTDYLLVKEEKLGVALKALKDAGHTIHVE